MESSISYRPYYIDDEIWAKDSLNEDPLPYGQDEFCGFSAIKPVFYSFAQQAMSFFLESMDIFVRRPYKYRNQPQLRKNDVFEKKNEPFHTKVNYK